MIRPSITWTDLIAQMDFLSILNRGPITKNGFKLNLDSEKGLKKGPKFGIKYVMGIQISPQLGPIGHLINKAQKDPMVTYPLES